MGMYTEINVCFDLLKDTPKDIVDILHYLVEGTDTPSILPEHKFFKCDRYADGELVYDYAKCHICGHEFEYEINDWGCEYCSDCGQKLDWSDKE